MSAIDKMEVRIYTISDLIRMYDDRRIVIDNSFQRKYVWSLKNEINLIESILLGFPIPEFIFLVDNDTIATQKYVVIDGQQRIRALMNFYHDEFELNVKHLSEDLTQSEFAGNKFSQLDEETKSKFFDYPLYIRLISSNLERSDIKNIFLRLNTTGLALNPQELRNAIYDGEFLRLSEELADLEFWNRFKIFSNNERRRMLDIQFVSSILIFFRMGINEETNAASYNKVYDMFNDSYPRKNDDRILFTSITMVLSDLFEYEEIRNFFKKKTHLYTLFILTYKILRKEKGFSDLQIRSLKKFIDLYSLRDNEKMKYMATMLLNDIDEYKKLSKTGTQQKTNRIRRVKLLERIVNQNSD